MCSFLVQIVYGCVCFAATAMTLSAMFTPGEKGDDYQFDHAMQKCLDLRIRWCGVDDEYHAMQKNRVLRIWRCDERSDDYHIGALIEKILNIKKRWCGEADDCRMVDVHLPGRARRRPQSGHRTVLVRTVGRRELIFDL